MLPHCCGAPWDEKCAAAANEHCNICQTDPSCPGEGNCCEPNGSPGCDDDECCELVCADEPFCCDVKWDQLCANLAFEHCTVCVIPGDLNGDGVVNTSDLMLLLEAWGPCPDPENCPADLNGDHVVDTADLLIMLQNWG